VFLPAFYFSSNIIEFRGPLRNKCPWPLRVIFRAAVAWRRIHLTLLGKNDILQMFLFSHMHQKTNAICKSNIQYNIDKFLKTPEFGIYSNRK
jgi:hypothetical protein